MLNELCQLADSLEMAGITPKDWHPQFRKLKNSSEKKPCYKILISEDRSVVRIETINSDVVEQLRKWEPNNGSSFPGFNIQPLYRIVGQDQKKKLKEWREGKKPVNIGLLKLWLTNAVENWDPKVYSKLQKCLSEVPLELSGQIGAENNKMIDDSMRKLISRIVQIPHGSLETTCDQGFRKILEKYLWSALQDADSVKTVLAFLVHEGDEKKTKRVDIDKDRGAISVFLDIPDWEKYPVASQQSIDALNSVLILDSQKETKEGESDAFGGSIEGGDSKLPEIKLQIIGKVGLRSMNHESVCQYRYGRIDAGSFPIGQESRKRAKGALEWLGDEVRKGETWGDAGGRELLFAYPSILPKVPVKLASLFGANKVDDSEARFSNAAQDAISALKELSTDLRNLELRVFSLKKMDATSSKTKIVFYRNYTARRLVDAAKDWQDGAGNIPEISFRVWGEDRKPISVTTQVPFPLQVPSCLNRVWKMDGNLVKTLKGDDKPLIHSCQGIELLLEEHPERFVNHLLLTMLNNSKGLLLFLANHRLQLDEKNRETVFSVSDKKKYEHHKLLIPSILGLLLHKLGIRKESYMSNAPFLVGRMLKLADELHALYCKEVRDNKMPPQLIGNSLMTAALDSPIQSLAQLALRLKPYYGWAQTYRSKETGGLAGYFIGLYGEVSSELANLGLPIRFNDAERAQLLLGYLAANPKKADKTPEPTNFGNN